MPLNNSNVLIIDYGMGNLFNLEKVLKFMGAEAVVSSESSALKHCRRAILPGVGAFGDGMKSIADRGLDEAIKKYVGSGKPLLGICLGLQLFMSKGEEFGLHNGLGLVRGEVKRFKDPKPEEGFYKIPHVGWNSLHPRQNVIWKKTIFDEVNEGSFVYFVHSYVVIPEDQQVILAETEYANIRFCSALHQGNIYGCQFHPEISGEVGLSIIKNFLCN